MPYNTGHPFKTVIGSHITKLEMFVGSEVSTAAIPLAAYQFLQALWRQSSAPFPPVTGTLYLSQAEGWKFTHTR